jgi:hypothetical protein
MTKSKTKQEFITESQNIHGDKYDYSKVEYTNYNTKVIIICKIHGEFEQMPLNHLKGKNCAKCSGKYKPSQIEFINNLKEKYANKFDYSKILYKTNKNKIILTCVKHNIEFQQIARDVMNGQNGCISCQKENKLIIASKITKSKEQFIMDSINTHGDKYDYSKVEYINSITKVIIICKEHGEFQQAPNSHLSGHGCKFCSVNTTSEKQRSCKEEFIEKAIKIHGDNYDYSKVDYKTSIIKVIIICKKHGEYKQTPNAHLAGKSCIKCFDDIRGQSTKSNKEEFIEKAKLIHGDTFDYSKVIYTNSTKKIIIICRKHGEFEQIPSGHLYGFGCKKCGTDNMKIKQSKTTEEFIEKAKLIHGDTFDYSEVEYTNSHTNIKIICKKHGWFEQSPSNHLAGKSCNRCAPRKYSIKAIKYLDFIAKYNNIFIQHQCNDGEYKIINTNYHADGYCKETNTIYEFHGTIFHGDPRLCKPTKYNYLGKNYGEIYQNTLIREKHIRDLGYNLVVMWEYDWDNIIKSVKTIQRKFRSNR